MTQIGSIGKIHCNSCSRTTNHVLKYCEKRSEVVDEEDDYGNCVFLFSEDYYYKLWECCGCGTCLLEITYSNSAMADWNGNEIFESEFYPERTYAQLVPKRFRKLDPDLAKIYKETIGAFNGGYYILCAAGLRALLEGICNIKIREAVKREELASPDSRTNDQDSTEQDKQKPPTEWSKLSKKLHILNKVLPANIVESLGKFAFLGNSALHGLRAPTQAELRVAIEVMEDLMNFLYDLEYKIGDLPEASSKEPHHI